ncbi:NADPH dehydrogenase [Gossypium arboreum]|uniref:NADPH dehydrogenase n=1 Tax=Gossypium arboreum TaxID=29729 RepID=A0A0B0PTY0_GOSAR|nr:NADPH dehydrogenase [Gossypium arboreum]
MGFKYKGIGWLGDVYQTFETLCHEVDNIVNQDTVKYVENQAQSVGKSMKRFYSDVIHDILPPLKHEKERAALKRSATIESDVKSMAAIEEDHIYTVDKLFHVEAVAVDPIEMQLGHASNELCLSDQLCTPTFIDGAESDMMPGQTSDGLKNTCSDVNIEKNGLMEKTSGSDVVELISPSEEESFGASLVNEFDVLKDTKPEVNMETATMEKSSASEVSELISPVDKEFCGASLLSEFIDCNDKEPWQVETEVSPATTVRYVRKPYASDVLELISPSEEASFGASMVHEFVDCNDKSACVVCTDVCCATSVHDDQNTRTVKNDLANDSDCVSDASSGITSLQMSSSAIRCQENMAEVRVGSSCASSIKDFCLPQNPPENLPAYKHLYHDSIDALSSLLTPLLSNEKKLTGALSIVSSNELSLESLGSIDDSIDDVSISSMYTIQLLDEVKLEDSCVIVDGTALYAASRIIRKHRSYKKRIQDVLTSKKRLAKEYEQLAIWFGDTDTGLNHERLQTVRPSCSSATSESKNIQTEVVSDSEWELL